MQSDIVPGAEFPDYELPDHTTKRRKLSELQGEDPMVVVLGRGGYCPKDRRQPDGFLQFHREMEIGYCRLVTISTDNITETNEYRTESARSGLSCLMRAVLSKRTRYRGVHRPSPQSDDPAHDRSGTRSRHLQDLHGLLVLWTADCGRFASGPACGA